MRILYLAKHNSGDKPKKPGRKLARKLGVSQQAMINVVNRITWRHVK